MQIPSNSFKEENQRIDMDIAKDVTVKRPEDQRGTNVNNNKHKEAKISDLQSQLWSKVTVNLERLQLTTLMDMLKLHQDGDKPVPGTSTLSDPQKPLLLPNLQPPNIHASARARDSLHSDRDFNRLLNI